MALPICFVGILVSIKNAVGDVEGDVIPAIIPDDRATLRPITFSDYMTALQAERTCVDVSGGSNDDFWITGIPNQGRDWPVPFVKCDSYLCEFDGEDAQKYCEYGIIGLAPTDVADAGGLERANDFRDWLIERYPAIADGSMPFGFDMVRVFDSNKEMEQYVKAGKYGDEGFPKIVMGVVFEGNDPNNFVYTLRQNSTNFNAPEEAARPTARTTPDTAQTFDSFAKNDFSVCDDDDGTPYLGRLGFSCTGQYFYNGVLPFQRLVNDFIMNVTGAAANGYYVAEDGMRFIPFPSPSYQDSGFFEDAAGTYDLVDGLRVMLSLSHGPCSVPPAHLGAWTLVPNCQYDSAYRSREAVAPERVDEDDECARVRHWMGLVLFVLLVSHDHRHPLCGRVDQPLHQLRVHLSFDLLGACLHLVHLLLDDDCDAHVQADSWSLDWFARLLWWRLPHLVCRVRYGK